MFQGQSESARLAQERRRQRAIRKNGGEPPAISKQELIARRKWRRNHEALEAAGLQWFQGGCVTGCAVAAAVATGMCDDATTASVQRGASLILTAQPPCPAQRQAIAGQGGSRPDTHAPAAPKVPQPRQDAQRAHRTAGDGRPQACCVAGTRQGVFRSVLCMY